MKLLVWCWFCCQADPAQPVPLLAVAGNGTHALALEWGMKFAMALS